MLKLGNMLRGRGDVIPAKLTILSLSWLNSQFKAVAVHRGAVTATWERPGDTEGPGQFEAFVREAVARTNYQGQTVSLVLAHPRLVQHIIELPPIKGPAKQRIIQRQAQQQKFFTGEAAWASETAFSAKGTQRVVLHLFPKLLLDQFMQGCKRNSLDLVSVVPLSVVLRPQLAQLALEDEEAVLLAAETGGSTTVVVGRSDGQVLLVRSLPSTWNGGVDRLAVDLNRTMLFLTQQYGVTLNDGVWLFGPGASEQAKALQAQMQLSISVSPVQHQPAYWATSVLLLRPGQTPNFVSPQLQKAPQRRAYAKVVGAGAVLLVLVALAAVVLCLRLARQETATIERLRQHAAQFEPRRQQVLQRNAALAAKQQVISLVLESQPPPVPAWFLAYLGTVVPSELSVTNLHLKRETNAWKLHLATAWQGTADQPTPAEMASTIAKLRAQLSSGPFHLAPPSSSEKDTSGHSGVGPKPAAADPLVIEGVIR